MTKKKKQGLHKTYFMLGGFIVAGLIAILALSLYSGDVDHCMDQGGCYDYDAKVCRLHEANAQELCDKSMGR